MNVRGLEARLHLLKSAKEELEYKKEHAEDAIDVRRFEDALIEIGGQIKEVDLWLDALDNDPQWGTYFRDKTGQRVPKLPTFASKEEREARMASPSGNEPGWTQEDVLRARESRAIDDAREAAVWLDGKSPYVEEDYEQERISEDGNNIRPGVIDDEESETSSAL